MYLLNRLFFLIDDMIVRHILW